MKLDVNCTEDYESYPICAIVDLDEDAANKIRLFSRFVQNNGLYKLEKFDYRPLWLGHDVLEDEPLTDEDRADTVPVEMVCLNVSGDDFWWSAYLKSSGVLIETRKVLIADLPKLIGKTASKVA